MTGFVIVAENDASKTPSVVAGAHTALARAWFDESPDLARAYAEKAVEIYEAIDDPAGSGWAYAVLGSTANLLGDDSSAIDSFHIILGSSEKTLDSAYRL